MIHSLPGEQAARAVKEEILKTKMQIKAGWLVVKRQEGRESGEAMKPFRKGKEEIVDERKMRHPLHALMGPQLLGVFLI